MGVIFDSVIDTHGTTLTPSTSADGWLHKARQFLEDHGVGGQIWKILSADLLSKHKDDSTDDFILYSDFLTSLGPLLSKQALRTFDLFNTFSANQSTQRRQQINATVLRHSIVTAARSRRLAFTRGSRGAYVPEKTLPGDMICILRGGRVPYVVRPLSNSEPGLYNFVGECWVEGLMHHQRDELSFDDEIKLM